MQRYQKLNLTRKVICRFAPEPPPSGPKKSVRDPLFDLRKYGDVMFPTGSPWLLRFRALLA
jgi:hypothetical protein